MSEQRASTDDERRHSEARARAEAKLGFYRHGLTYLIVITGLAVINLSTTSYLWFLWPAAGWGFGLLMHAFNVFVFSDKILQRMTERELRRARSNR